MLGGLGPLPLELRAHAESGWSAEQHARVCADLVASARTLPFAVMWMNFGAGWSPIVTDYLGRNGVGPAHAPTPTRDGVGNYVIEWAPSYQDSFGLRAPVNLTRGHVTARHTVSYGGAVTIEEPNVCRVRMYTTSSGAATDTYFFLVVW